MKAFDWGKYAEIGTSRPKCTFLNEPRSTITDKVFLQEKRHPKPGPNKYLEFESWNKHQPRILGNYKYSLPRVNFTEEAQLVVGANPPMKYDIIDLEKVRERTINTRFKKDRSVGVRLKKLKQENSPSPQTYLPETAYSKFQEDKTSK